MSTSKFNVLLIGMPGCGNMGDDLISNEIIKMLLLNFSNISINVVTGRIDYQKVYADSVKYLLKPNVRKIIKYTKYLLKLRSILNKTNLLIVGGGGLLQDVHSISNIYDYLKYVHKVPRDCKKIIFNVGVGPIINKINKRYLGIILRYYDSISVRDQESKKMIQNLYSKPIHVDNDIVFCSEYLHHKNNNLQPKIGVSIRPWSNITYEDSVEILSATINLTKINRVNFYVFEISDTEEINLLKRLMEHMIDKHGCDCELKVYSGYNAEDMIKNMAQTSFAIASRFHANVIWQKLKIPTLPIVYSPKVRSLYEDRNIRVHSVREIVNIIRGNKFDITYFKSIEVDMNNNPRLSINLNDSFNSEYTRKRMVLLYYKLYYNSKKISHYFGDKL